jgi:hypothetical protein
MAHQWEMVECNRIFNNKKIKITQQIKFKEVIKFKWQVQIKQDLVLLAQLISEVLEVINLIKAKMTKIGIKKVKQVNLMI